MKQIALATLMSLLAACGAKDDGPKEVDSGHEEHQAKHGGELLILGDHEAFVEVKEDHDAGSVTIWLYVGEEMKDTTPAQPPVLNVATDDGAKQLTGKGAGSQWTFTGDVLKEGHHKHARFRISLGGKTYTPELAHEH